MTTPHFDPNYRGEIADRWIARLAAGQHGVLARRQLLRAGFHPKTVDYRLKVGRLHLVHRGVYAVGHPVLTPDGRLMGAVLACGDHAVLSHRTGGRRHGVHDAATGLIDVTVPREHRPRRRGVRGHLAAVPPDEVTVIDGIPVTSLARTVVDLSGLLTEERMRVVLARAERAQLDWEELRRLADRYRAGKLQALIDSFDLESGVTYQELEARFLEFLAERGLPRPELNQWIQLRGVWIRPDCLWRKQSVIAELDSLAHHDNRVSFGSDRSRMRGLQADGWSAIPVTWRDLTETPEELGADLRKLLLI